MLYGQPDRKISVFYFDHSPYLDLNFLSVSSGCKEGGASVTDLNLVLHYQQVQLIDVVGTCSCS